MKPVKPCKQRAVLVARDTPVQEASKHNMTVQPLVNILSGTAECIARAWIIAVLGGLDHLPSCGWSHSFYISTRGLFVGVRSPCTPIMVFSCYRDQEFTPPGAIDAKAELRVANSKFPTGGVIRWRRWLSLFKMSFQDMGSLCCDFSAPIVLPVSVRCASIVSPPLPGIGASCDCATVLPKISGTMQIVPAKTEAADVRKRFEQWQFRICFACFPCLR
jgi:hypothetical protein